MKDILEMLYLQFKEKYPNASDEEFMTFVSEELNKAASNPTAEELTISEFEVLFEDPFSKNSPIALNILTPKEREEPSLIKQVLKLLELLEEGGIKLTKIGNLPTKIVRELYDCGTKEHDIENGITKLHTQNDSISVQMIRIILEEVGWVKKRKNELTLTKKGVEIRSRFDELTETLFNFLFTKFNHGYFDYYEYSHIGSYAMSYSLYLVGRYGNELRDETFYANKYFEAFPELLNFGYEMPKGVPSVLSGCYALRTFERCFHLLGIIEIVQTKGYDQPDKIRKTELFDRIFTIKKPLTHQADNSTEAPIQSLKPTHDMENRTLKTSDHSLQLKISLVGTTPPVWRRIVVDPNVSMMGLHDAIQSVMPWSNMHLHQFIDGNNYYGDVDEEFPNEYDDMTPYHNLTIGDFLQEKGDKIKYEYDFGDDWVHNIVVEKVLAPLTPDEPRCKFITGKRCCPPEDIGGIYGYEQLRAALVNPKSEEYQTYTEWLDDRTLQCILENRMNLDLETVNFMMEEIE